MNDVRVSLMLNFTRLNNHKKKYRIKSHNDKRIKYIGRYTTPRIIYSRRIIHQKPFV